MKISDLLDEIGARPHHRLNYCNVIEVRPLPNGDLYLETNQEEVEELKQDIKENEDTIKDMEAEAEKLSANVDRLESELTKAREALGQVKDGDLSLRDIVDENEALKAAAQTHRRALSDWRDLHEKQAREIKDLRSRKNKATVSRCVKTGKLLANYNDQTFALVPHV